MGDFNTPSQISVDPTPQALRPLQDVLARTLFSRFTQPIPQSPNIFQGQPNALEQLFGPFGGGSGGSSGGFIPGGQFIGQPGGAGAGTGGLNGSQFLGQPGGVEQGAGAGAPGLGSIPGQQFLPVSSQTGSGQQNQFTNQFLTPNSGGQALEQNLNAFSFGGGGGIQDSGEGPGQLPGGGFPGGGDVVPNGPTNPVEPIPDPSNPGATIPGGTGTQPGTEFAGFPTPSFASFDLPGFQNPFDASALFGAPLTFGQQDALSGFRNLFDPTQIVSNQQQAEAVQAAIGGNQVFDPRQGGTLREAIQPFDVRSNTQQDLVNQIINSSLGLQAGQAPQLPGNFQQAFSQSLSGQPVDVSGVQDASRQAFQGDLDEIIARERESASAFGLNPGAFDRSRGVLEGAGRAAAQFNLGQEQLGLGALENAAQRQLGAVGQGAPFLSAGAGSNLANAQAQNIGTQNLLGLLPQVQQGDFGNLQSFLSITEPAAQRSQQTLGLLPSFSNLPFEQAGGLFNINERARQVADVDLQRRMQEFARTQGGALNQILSLFGASSPMQTGFGPSGLSQVASLGGGLASLFA